MFNRLKKLYAIGAIDEAGLTRAVNFGWISEAQKAQIVEG